MDLSKEGASEVTGQSIIGTCSGVISPLTEARRSPNVILINIIAATVLLSKELKEEVGSTRTITKNTDKALNIKREATETQVSAYIFLRG